jgi:hypothetical protein
MDKLFERKIYQVMDPENPRIRYGLSKNPIRGQKDKATRQALITKVEELLGKIATLKGQLTMQR